MNLNSKLLGCFKRITDSEGNAFQNSLCHVLTRGVHCHTDETAACSRIIVRCTLAHQVRQIIDMIAAKLIICDPFLLCRIILCAENLIHKPLVAGCGRKHAAHQMEAAVCVCKCVKCISAVYAKGIGGDENCTGGSE